VPNDRRTADNLQAIYSCKTSKPGVKYCEKLTVSHSVCVFNKTIVTGSATCWMLLIVLKSNINSISA
jgi:hypothetical protein